MVCDDIDRWLERLGTMSGLQEILDKKEFYFSGERGIRTPGTVARTAVFETAPLNHSGTSPCNTYYFDAFLASSFILSRNVSSTLK